MNFSQVQEKYIFSVYIYRKDRDDYKPSKAFIEMLSNEYFYNIVKELVDLE